MRHVASYFAKRSGSKNATDISFLGESSSSKQDAAPQRSFPSNHMRIGSTVLAIVCICFPAFAQAEGVPKAVLDAKRSVAKLSVMDADLNLLGTATGFRFGKDEVVTNYHIATGAQTVVAEFEGGKRYFLDIATGYDAELDLLALTSTASSAELSSIPALAHSGSMPEVGTKVFVVGSPRGLAGSVSDGIVSAIRGNGVNRLIQITAAISPGSSGSPLLSSESKVLGVVSSSLVDSQQINFAIPIALVSELERNVPLPINSLKASKPQSLVQDASVSIRPILQRLSELAAKHVATTEAQLKPDDLLRPSPYRETLRRLGREAENLKYSRTVPRLALTERYGWPQMEESAFWNYLMFEIDDAERSSLRSAADEVVGRNPESAEAWRLVQLLYGPDVARLGISNRAVYEIARLDKHDPIARLEFLRCFLMSAGTGAGDTDLEYPNYAEAAAQDRSGFGGEVSVKFRATVSALTDPTESIALLRLLGRDERWANTELYLLILAELHRTAGVREVCRLAAKQMVGPSEEPSELDVLTIDVPGISLWPQNAGEALNATADTLRWVEQRRVHFDQALELFLRRCSVLDGRARSFEAAGARPPMGFYCHERIADLAYLLGDMDRCVEHLTLPLTGAEARLQNSIGVHKGGLNGDQSFSSLMRTVDAQLKQFSRLGRALRLSESNDQLPALRARLESYWGALGLALSEAEKATPAFVTSTQVYQSIVDAMK